MLKQVWQFLSSHLTGLATWVKRTLSERDGTPSTARHLSALLAVVASIAVLALVALAWLGPPATVAEVLSSLPAIIAALTGLAGIHYAFNRFTNRGQ